MSLTYTLLEDLFDTYDAFLIDQFGVLMSGTGAYPGAPAALASLGTRSKPTLILSNSGKRSEPNCARLVDNGFRRSDFLTVVSSGEIARDYLLEQTGKSIPHNGKAYVMIREGDHPPLDGVDLQITDKARDADVLMIVSRDPARDVSFYADALKELSARNVPCLCLNPDRVMLTSSGLTQAAGYLADLYAELGGSVIWFGKPHGPAYQRAIQLLAPVETSRVLCIGDSLSHDIAGGRRAGCKTALVRTGIHADLTDEELSAEMRKLDLYPDYVFPEFSLSSGRKEA